MKKKSVFTIVVYIAALILLFSWLLGLFGGGHDGLTYSQVVDLFHKEQVKAFLVDDGKIYMELHSPYNGKSTVTARMADVESFRADMAVTFQQQLDSGVLESYDFAAEKKASPYDYILPITIAGAILIFLYIILAGRANSNNPMNNFGKARTTQGSKEKITFQDVAGVDEEKA